MAGNYPDTPGRRMAWDEDGSVVLGYVGHGGGAPAQGEPPSTTLVDFSTQDKQYVNGEDNSAVSEGVGSLENICIAMYIFFPEKRELDGYYMNGYRSAASYSRYLTHSENSTNGKDGTFTAWGTQTWSALDVNPDYRNNIESSALSNKRVAYIQLSGGTSLSASTAYLRAGHIYGRITPGSTPDRLIFLNTAEADSQYTVLIDYGDVPRGQTKTYTIKVKNNSASLTAATCQITAQSLVGNSDAWYSFSIGGGAYQTTGQLGSIGPGSVVPVTYKQAVPDAELLGLHAARFKVNQASWS